MLLGKSTSNILIKSLSEGIQAGLGLHLAHYDSRRARNTLWYSAVCSGDVGSIGRPCLEHGVSTAKTLDPLEEKNGGRRVD
jgi:hypothetical protein